MKSFLIFILTAALLAAAFFTRPSRDDFKRYMTDSTTRGAGNVLQKGWDEHRAAQFVDGCQIKDRFLWVDVQKDGKTVYTGAFSHWFNRDQVTGQVQDKVEKVQDTIHIIEKK
jgi:hypothetical protein